MHILKANSFYARYIKWFYDRHPQLKTASYNEQLSALLRDGFCLADAWQRHVHNPGNNCIVTELVVNAEYMQKQWAKENGVSYSEDNWMHDIFLAQFRAYQPNILYAQAWEIGPSIQKKCKEIKKNNLYVITYDGIGRHAPEVYQESNLVITCLLKSAEYYRSKGVDSHWMMFGFDPVVLDRIDRSLEASPVSFVGGVDVRIGHQERARTLAHISGKIPVERWISGLPSDLNLIRLWASFARHGDWHGFRDFPSAALAARRLREGNRGELFGMDMFSRLAASKITLNVHIAAAGNQAANIRLFEATGAGACLVTDWKDNIGDLFEPDREIVVFRKPEEAVEKIKYLLNNESERAQIALRGQQRTLNEHNYSLRFKELIQLIENRA